ncbi:MAG TPA: cryptochrome/photolyase family protein [Polyangiales bacterium]|nr:cryptochrome/photolyase family protein [Polyangiales bacterium]
MTGTFLRELRRRTPAHHERRWIYVPYDQLTDQHGPLAEHAPEELGIVMLENPAKARRRPYHKQKLAMVLANGRQFALEQAARGVAVRWGVADAQGYAGTLRQLARELGPLTMMEAAERELRVELAPLLEDGTLKVVPHAGWLTTEEEFRAACPAPPWRMDAFYRALRKRRGWLMEKGKPLGGKWSHDADNRKPWHGQPAAPSPPRFEPDAITREVLELIERDFPQHPGRLDGALPSTLADAERLWSWAKDECLPLFGPYEDAMSDRSSGLFHTRLSALLNLQRLSASRLVEEALSLHIDLPSQEGFLRQLAGWREYMRHVHRATDGFRTLPNPRAGALKGPGDGGYARWAGKPWPTPSDGDGGSNVSQMVAHQPLPPAYWGRESGLHCPDSVVEQVWSEGYSHHITRLMVLANIAMLLDVSPRELTDWFWVAYVDAYDWVVEPNVLAMGSFGTGDLITTKPYIAGSAYIDRMSDFCKSCRFDPRKNCPLTPLYWGFLARHQGALQNVARMDMPLRSLHARSAQLRARDRRMLTWVHETLAAGKPLRPEEVP